MQVNIESPRLINTRRRGWLQRLFVAIILTILIRWPASSPSMDPSVKSSREKLIGRLENSKLLSADTSKACPGQTGGNSSAMKTESGSDCPRNDKATIRATMTGYFADSDYLVGDVLILEPEELE
jgi:hypothetical protein